MRRRSQANTVPKTASRNAQPAQIAQINMMTSDSASPAVRLTTDVPTKTPNTATLSPFNATSRKGKGLSSKRTSMECPTWELGETVTPSPHHPIGAKGVGESATVGSPAAVVNAVLDALQLRHAEMPLTPAAVWRAIQGDPITRPDLAIR